MITKDSQATPQLHPWLSTPEARDAAWSAVGIPLKLMFRKAMIVGADELYSEALVILTECALPPLEPGSVSCARCFGPLDGVRTGAKFCSARCRNTYNMSVRRGRAETLSSRKGVHVGAMWSWPEDDRMKYAIREVGYALNNYLRTWKVEATLTDMDARPSPSTPRPASLRGRSAPL